MNAAKLKAKVGDSMEIRQGGKEQHVTVTGTYQDVTSAGRTAKMQGEVPGHIAEVLRAWVPDVGYLGPDPAAHH